MVILVCLSLLGYCFAFTRLTKYPIEYAPFFVISSCITLLYIFAYGQFLQNGANGILIVGWVLLLTSTFFIKNHFQKYFTPGFVISTVFLVIFLLFAFHTHLSLWDEFTQWGPHDKLVYFNNGFIRASDITVYKCYPLGGSLFHYLFFRLDGFSEGNAYVAQSLLMMAPLSILVHSMQWSSWKKVFFIYGVTLLILLLLHVKIGPIGSLYMDTIIGIYAGMSIIAYLSSEKKVSIILYLIPSIIAMTLFKQKILPFVLLITGVIFIDQFLLLLTKKNNIKSLLKMRAAVLLLPIMSLFTVFSWHQHLKNMRVPIAHQLHLSIANLKAVFFAPTGSVSHIIITNYLHACTHLLFFVIIMMMLAVIAYCLYDHTHQKQRLVIIHLILFAGWVLFAFSLLLMYLFTFTPYEAMEHASLYRYFSIYNIMWVLVALYFIFDAMRHQISNTVIENIGALFVLIGLITFFSVNAIQQNHLSSLHENTWQLRQPIIKIANAVKKITKNNATILSVWQDSTGLEHAMMMYELMPRKTLLGCMSYGKPYNTQDVWTCHMTTQQFQQRLLKAQYLLLAYVDKNFWSHYGVLIPHNKKLKPLVAYSICHDQSFSSFGASGCRMKIHHAYLFKIIKGKLYAES